jgi:hypothetical protein
MHTYKKAVRKVEECNKLCDIMEAKEKESEKMATFQSVTFMTYGHY